MTVLFWTLAPIRRRGAPEAFAVEGESKTLLRGTTLGGLRTSVQARKCHGRFGSRNAALAAEREARSIHAAHSTEIRKAEQQFRRALSQRDISIAHMLSAREG